MLRRAFFVRPRSVALRPPSGHYSPIFSPVLLHPHRRHSSEVLLPQRIDASPPTSIPQPHPEDRQRPAMVASLPAAARRTAHSSPPNHRHDGTSPLPLGRDWTPKDGSWKEVIRLLAVKFQLRKEQREETQQSEAG